MTPTDCLIWLWWSARAHRSQTSIIKPFAKSNFDCFAFKGKLVHKFISRLAELRFVLVVVLLKRNHIANLKV